MSNIQKIFKKTHNFILGPCDTDSISFCKQGFSEFTKEEQDELLKEINSYMPKYIEYKHDGYFKSALVLKTKNYCLFDGNKKKIKGSAFKSSNKEPIFKQFMDSFVDILLNECPISDQINLYHNYVNKIMNITDIKPFCSKKTVTEKVLNPERTNESKILQAIKNKEYSIGEKVYLYFDKDDNLKEYSDWNNDHNTNQLLKRLFNTIKIFESVININDFKNFSLKKNQESLNNLSI